MCLPATKLLEFTSNLVTRIYNRTRRLNLFKMPNFIKNIGTTEIIIIALILILLFGAKIVSRMARTGGETVREMKKIKKDFNDAVEGKDSNES